jgi:hypothetical protein
MHRASLWVFAVVFISSIQASGQRTDNFPKEVEYVKSFPVKENFWIFLMAGQSNMAGRGLVEAQDTIPHPRILTFDEKKLWVRAKEPLHFYEPQLTGLDCGLSFGKQLIQAIPEEVTIGLVPCAVGGSSIRQWLCDSIRKEVQLLSNFKSRLMEAERYGLIKGIIWHQGETDAHQMQSRHYAERLRTLFSRFRNIAGDDSLPIVAGELGNFTFQNEQPLWDSVNMAIHEVAGEDPLVSVITTADLHEKGDSIHFDSPSLRLMGERYAEHMLLLLDHSNQTRSQ